MDEFLKLHSMPKTENVKFVSEKQVFTFGRNKGRSFGEVFETDVPYVIWILKSSQENRKYFKNAYNYFKDRIEGVKVGENL